MDDANHDDATIITTTTTPAPPPPPPPKNKMAYINLVRSVLNVQDGV